MSTEENQQDIEKNGGEKEIEELRKTREEQAKQINDLQKELVGLKNKDFNYKKLRDMTEEEKGKLTALEMELKTRQEKLEEDQRTFKEQVIFSHKADALAVLAGDNDELRKKVEFHFDRIKDVATTKEEIGRKMKEAFLLATGTTAAQIDQISRVMGGYSPTPSEKKAEKLTAGQRDLAKKLGITEEDLKKHNLS